MAVQRRGRRRQGGRRALGRRLRRRGARQTHMPSFPSRSRTTWCTPQCTSGAVGVKGWCVGAGVGGPALQASRQPCQPLHLLLVLLACFLTCLSCPLPACSMPAPVCPQRRLQAEHCQHSGAAGVAPCTDWRQGGHSLPSRAQWIPAHRARQGVAWVCRLRSSSAALPPALVPALRRCVPLHSPRR
jgi:hypothetical protein